MEGTAMRYRLRNLRKLSSVRHAARVRLPWILVGVIAAPAWAAELPLAMPVKAPLQVKAPAPQLYDWTGFYAGVHIGDAWGRSNWTAQPDGLPGSLNMFQRYDAFEGTGSWFGGAQVGYDYIAAQPGGDRRGGRLLSAKLAKHQQYFDRRHLDVRLTDAGSGELERTVRGRVGYAPGNWLLYATGGFAWAYDQLTVTQLDNSGTTDSPFLWRLGWAAGAGVEMPLAPNWTAGLEYLYTRYGNSTVGFANAGQTFQSNLALHELRLTLNYRPGSDQKPGNVAASWFAPSEDRINVHGQTTFVWQSYPAIRSPYEGPNSLPARGQGRETVDATLYAGIRLWQGAEVWLNPEVDQGHGLADTHGAAGYLSGESYKLGFSYPYVRMQRMFLRQTVNLGGEGGTVAADINQFANTFTSNRLVMTVGKFGIVDIFDTNKYANNPKTDFLNWALINAGTFDYAGDAWGYTYGGALEWYQD
jgi:high affinity Mn2+ porin